MLNCTKHLSLDIFFIIYYYVYSDALPVQTITITTRRKYIKIVSFDAFARLMQFQQSIFYCVVQRMALIRERIVPSGDVATFIPMMIIMNVEEIDY